MTRPGRNHDNPAGAYGGVWDRDDETAIINPIRASTDQEPVATRPAFVPHGELPSPRVPYEICWLILEELLGLYSEGMERKESGKEIILKNFQIVRPENVSSMAYLRVNKAFRDMLVSIMSRVKLVYHGEICTDWSRYSPVGRQAFSMGKAMASQLQEIVLYYDYFQRGYKVNSGVCAGLGMVMEDRRLTHLIATLESSTHVPLGILVVLSADWHQDRSGALARPDTRQLVSQNEIPMRHFRRHWMSMTGDIDGAKIGNRGYVRWNPEIQRKYHSLFTKTMMRRRPRSNVGLNALLQLEEEWQYFVPADCEDVQDLAYF